MLKILHVTPVYFPAFKYGGPSVSEYKMDKTLATKGLIIDVMTTNAGLEKRTDIVLNQWIDHEGIRIKYFPYFFKDNYTFSPPMLWSILNEAKNYDIIHLQLFWSFSTLAGSIGSLVNKKPYVISPGGALYKDAIYMKSQNVKKLYFHLIAKHCVRRANAIFYTTEDERDNVADFLKLDNKSSIIPIGVDLNEYKKLPEKGLFKSKYSILKDKRYILFLGRINKKKGVDILVEAFKELAKDYNDLYLVIAGPDNDGYKKKIEKKLKDYCLLEKVLFPGILSEQEKLSAYVDAEAYVLSSYSENFAVTIIESIACGTPVVISNKIGIFEIIQKYDAGVIVDLNSRDLYRGIKTLLEDPVIGAQFVENGRRLIEEKYDIAKVADLQIKAYEDIVLSSTKILAAPNVF